MIKNMKAKNRFQQKSVQKYCGLELINKTGKLIDSFKVLGQIIRREV
jgi:hypothetical protein